MKLQEILTTTVQMISVILSTISFAAAKPNRIAVQATASREYTLSRADVEAGEIQTYHLIKGKYFGGNVDDQSLEEVSFADIARELAANLERQNFLPEADPERGDLLIMVHYGATIVTTIDGSFNQPTIDTYIPPVKTASGEVYDYNLSREAISESVGKVLPDERAFLEEKYFRAKILGIDDLFDPTVSSYDAYIQEVNAAEGRYFFVMTAFDLPLLRQSEKKVLWTTRYNVRMIGQPFDQAVKELNLVASDYFGKNFDGIISKRVTDDSQVEIGEIEVIDQDGLVK